MHICISTEQIRSKNLGIRSSKCFQTLCLAMAVNHFWLFPPNCFDAIVCYMGSRISPMDSPPNKWAHEQHNILHLMCNNTAEQPVKKQTKNPIHYTFLQATCYWYYSGTSSSFTLYPSSISLCTFAASIIFDKSEIFHDHASGRFPSTSDGSIISSSFAWLKPDKHNALCSSGNAFCIILVFEYVSEYLPLVWSQFLAMSFESTDIVNYSRM